MSNVLLVDSHGKIMAVCELCGSPAVHSRIRPHESGLERNASEH